MTSPLPATAGGPDDGSAPGAGVWVVLPTYQEAENIGPISAAILDALPAATLLVVDDGSPDGTGELADGLAAADPRIRVLHRPSKQGLGRAYLDGFGRALDGGARVVVQMDADFSHDPAVLPTLIGPVTDGSADLVIGSRYTHGRRGGRLGAGPADHLAGRQRVRPDRPRPRAQGPDRRLQGVASRDAGRRAVRRDPRGRLRLPDRDDVPRRSAWRPDRRGPDHLPGPAGRAEQDVAPDRGRGAGRRGPAPRGGALAGGSLRRRPRS